MKTDLITHLFIEAYFNRKGLLTEEHFLYGEERKQLFESYGVFDGCEEAAEEILDVIQSHLQKNGNGNATVYCYPESLSFFTEEVVIRLSEDFRYCAYSHGFSNFNDKDGRFSFIYLKINPKLERSTLLVALMHELTHAYQDYNLRIKGSSLTQVAKKEGYSKTARYMSMGRDDMIGEVSRVMYLLNQFERGAYMASLLGIVKNILQQHQFENIRDALEYIKNNSTVLKNYNTIKSYVDAFESYGNYAHLDDGITERLLDVANEVSGYKFKTYKEFVVWITSRMNKVLRKIDKYLYVIIDKYLTVNEYMLPSNIADLIFEEKT